MMEVEVLRLAVYILCRGGGLVERDSCAAGKQESLEHCKCKRLHRKRSIAGYGNRVFSDLAVDLYDKHVWQARQMCLSPSRKTPHFRA